MRRHGYICLTEDEWRRALEWLEAWRQGVARVNPGTAASRDGFARTLREIQTLPQVPA